MLYNCDDHLQSNNAKDKGILPVSQVNHEFEGLIELRSILEEAKGGTHGEGFRL